MAKVPEPLTRWSPMEKAIIVLIPALTGGWAVVVGLSGSGSDWFGIEWDFQRTALLGDSFGVIGAIMATAAAAFTFLTLRSERAENARLRTREIDRDRSDRKREAEATFFQLLNLRNQMLERIKDPRRAASLNPVRGQDAVKTIANGVAQEVLPVSESSQAKHDEYWSTVEGEFGHYLRFTYHIIRFVVSNFDDDRDRYVYIRLLRAQLSNAEVQLIALNSIWGAGKPKMTKFIEDFSLLHNLPSDMINRLELKSNFAPSAFDSKKWQDVSSEPID